MRITQRMVDECGHTGGCEGQLLLFAAFHGSQQEANTLFFKGGVICIFEVIDISPGSLNSSASSSLAFILMYSAYKLNKQVDIYCIVFDIYCQVQP